MTDDIDVLLDTLRVRIGLDRFRELLRSSLEAEDQRQAEAEVTAHLDEVAAGHSSSAWSTNWPRLAW